MSALMAGLASGAILVPLNSTMLAVALPDVMAEFGLGPSTVASLVTLYLGSVAIALPVSGALGDRYGHRRIFVAGVLGFGAASALASVATSFGILELARILQAVCGALVSTTSTVLVREAAPPERTGEAFGIFDLLVSTSAAVGPFLGGLLVGGFGWRSMFVLAVPIALLAAGSVLLLQRRGPEPRHRRPSPLDVRGLVLLGLTIAGILALLRSGLGGPGPAIAAATIVVAIAFVLVELRTEQPAIDVRDVVRPSFGAALVGVFGATVVLHGCFLIVPLLVEELRGGTARTSGLTLLGIAGVSALVAPAAGRLSDRRGRRNVVIVGSGIVAAALVVLWTPPGAATVLGVGVLLGVVGLGLGLSGSPRQAAAFDGVATERLGMAAGTYYTARYLGGVLGASLGGAALGATVTSGGVSTGFGILAGAAILVTISAFGLRQRSPVRSLPTPIVDG
jgi:EmrB/QacA subfamily drug resistance transporter